ncbi:hypothetical protein FNV43_RR26516 [Rhamnella rubrinervis]|uniref:Uncharacterized protein n=1 Tax=Rhamnella rubrinervis TaxID=2594499 RepID=A0A8K0DIX9_9ROSA|nr:hypothetical protein FNV43_RR26516 [Rhamnella rubrinervis]
MPLVPFSSRSGSNRLSSSRHKVVVNRSGIRGNEADEIPQNEGEENNIVDSSAINFHNGAEEPTINYYDKLYNIPELDVEYNNDTYGERHEYEDEDIKLDEDETVYNETGGDGNELNATLPVHVTNADIPFVPMVGSPIASISNNNRGRHYPVRNESESQPSEAQIYQSINRPSTSSNEPSSSNHQSIYSNDETSAGQIYSNKKELQ